MRRNEITARCVDNRRTDAAMAIQSLFRGFRCRTQIIPAAHAERAKLLHLLLEQDAANTSAMSSSTDEAQQPQPVHDNPKSEGGEPHSISSLTREEQAAMTITQFMRIAAAKRCMNDRQGEVSDHLLRETQRQSAACIQRTIRAYLARQTVGALRLQRAVSHQALRQEEGALIIQAFFKIIVAKRKVKNLKANNVPIGPAKPSVRELVQRYEGMEI